MSIHSINDKSASGPRIISIALYFLLVRDLVAGVFRYFTESNGLGFLWFVPDCFAFLVLIYIITHYEASIKRRLVFLIPLVAVALISGLALTESSLALATGIKFLFPLIFGLVVSPFLGKILEKVYLNLVLWLIAVAGVVLNTLIDYPWTGYTFIHNGMERAAAADWVRDGESRFGGLGNDGHGTAFVILIFCMCVSMRVNFAARVALYVASYYAISITTSRTALVAFFVLVFLDLMRYLISVDHFFSRILFSFFFVSPIVIPFLSVVFLSGYAVADLPTWLESYWMRATESWIDPLRLILDVFPLGFLTGLGFGMAGSPSGYTKYTANYVLGCDNFVLELFVVFGGLGLAFFVFVLFAFMFRRSESGNTLLAVLLFYGISIEGFGNVTYCIFVGAALLDGVLLQVPSSKMANAWAGLRSKPCYALQE